MKTVSGLFAILAVGILAMGSASAQMMGPTPSASTTATNTAATNTAAAGSAQEASPPLWSRTMLSRSLDNYFAEPMPAATPAEMKTSQNGAAPAPAAAPDAPQHPVAYSSVHTDQPYIAITFDDGPNPETTPKLLKILKQRGIHATFFVLGSRATQNPEILKQMIADGHEIGNHSWNHPQLPKISRAEVDRQITTTSDAIEKATGQRPTYLRPPYGEMTPALRDYISKKYGMTFIYWSVDTLDWKYRKADRIYDLAMKETGRGGIILAHDIHSTTVDAMPRVLDALLAKGYKFVTMSELIAMDKPQEKVVASATPKPAKKSKTASSKSSKSSKTASKSSSKPSSSKSSSTLKPQPVSASASPKRADGLY